jgi:hypothetical protein
MENVDLIVFPLSLVVPFIIGLLKRHFGIMMDPDKSRLITFVLCLVAALLVALYQRDWNLLAIGADTAIIAGMAQNLYGALKAIGVIDRIENPN